MILLLRRYLFVIGGILIIGILFIFLFVFDKHGEAIEQDVIDLDAHQPDLADENEVETVIDDVWLVDIKGAIKKPGVYFVSQEDRVIDVIDQAGGFTNKADEDLINLAEKVTDEMVIYIPMIGEETIDVAQTGKVGANNSDGKVKINDATLDEMTRLNGIGPKKAQAIIDYREENGPFEQIEDILNVSGIGEKTLDNFRDDIIIP